jgi:hypothetical protein
MKEVKVLTFRELSGKGTLGQTHQRPNVEEGLADLLNDGWELSGTGGANVIEGFVILVRDHLE